MLIPSFVSKSQVQIHFYWAGFYFQNWIFSSREGFPWWPIVRKWNWFFCVVLWRHYHAPVFWILWKLRFWSCASLSFIRTKVVWYICSQSGTFKAIFRYYETSYNLHKSRDKNLTWVTDFEKHQIVADWSKSYREENRKTNLKGTKISHGENTKAYKWMNTLFRRLKIRDLLRNESWIMNHKL